MSGKTVAKLMRQAGIRGISPRGFLPVTTTAGPDPQPVSDLVGRRFDRGQLNLVWTSDLTYLPTGEGWLFLCAVRDGCSRRVVGWAVEDHLRTDLVEAALRRAVALRGELPQKVIFHADRGTQTRLNRSSQRCLVESTVGARRRLRQASSRRESCGVDSSGWWRRRRGRLGSIGTGRCP